MAGKNQVALAVCAQKKVIFPFKTVNLSFRVALFVWRYFVFSLGVLSSFRCFGWRLFAWRLFVFSPGVISSFRVALFRLFAWRLFVWRYFVFLHGVISGRKDEIAQTSHHTSDRLETYVKLKTYPYYFAA